MKACAACGRALNDDDKRRKFCDATCRKRGHRGVEFQAVTEDSSALITAVRKELHALGEDSSAAGLALVAVAVRIAEKADTAQGVAAAAKALDEGLARLRERRPQSVDLVDELSALRESRRSG